MQTLFFQQNNDIHLLFILIFISIIFSHCIKKNTLYHSQFFLLAFLGSLKIFFLPVLFLYSIFVYISNLKNKNININVNIIFILIFVSVFISLIDIKGIYKNSHVPIFYTYGFNSIKVLSNYFRNPQYG